MNFIRLRMKHFIRCVILLVATGLANAGVAISLAVWCSSQGYSLCFI